MINRDYKTAKQRSRIRLKAPIFSKMHWYLLAGSMLVIGSVLAFSSKNAEAIRTQELKLNAPLPITELELSLPSKPSEDVDWTNEAAQQQDTHTRTSITIEKGDSLAKVFQRLGLSPQQLHQIVSHQDARTLRDIMPGEVLHFTVDENKDVIELVYQPTITHQLKILNDNGSYQFIEDIKEPEIRIAHADGTIESSLYVAGQSAGLPDSLIMELANIFGWDIDFALDIREQDAFTVLYEERYLEGEKIGNGGILAASFTNQGNVYEAVRYTDPNGNTNYFTPDGKSMRKAFLRSPVDFTRISSGFGKRFHPVLNRMRAHNGVDYAASTGTPIKATGDGRINFRGIKGGYGNTVIVQHGSQYQTLYAHLSSFKKGLGKGSTVKQGQVIGYVGSSGLATGPHLHYEFQVNGVHRNPLTIRFPDAAPINPAYKADFMAASKPLLAQLTLLSKTSVAQSTP